MKQIKAATLTAICLTALGCSTPPQSPKQLPITPMLGHPYPSSAAAHNLEPRWGDPLSVQQF